MRSLMDIGIQSLMANQYAMTVSSQNVANSEVPSYSRRDVLFSEEFFGLYGSGVSVANTRRIFDEAVNRSLVSSISSQTKSDTCLQNLKDFEVMFDENSYSISNYINESLTALNVINVNPASAQSRELYLYQMQNIASRFNTIDENITAQQKGVNKSLQSDVTVVNQVTARLAQINGVIPMVAQEERDNLLDQRDALLSTLSQYMAFDSNVNDRGVLSIELSNGTPLLLGSNAYALETYPAADEPSRLEIAVVNNQSHIRVTHLITSGDIGGQLAYQNTALDEAKNSLGRLALVMSQKFNEQNRLGMDLNGNLGGNIFTDINRPDAMTHRVIYNTANQGGGDLAIRINNASQLTDSDYELAFDSPTHYQVMRKSDNQVMGDGTIASFPTSIDLEGFSLNIDNGNFVAGDKFTLSPTKYAARDIALEINNGSKLALGLPVATSASDKNTGTGVISLTAVTDTGNNAFIMSGYLNPPIRVEFISANSYRLINANDNSVLEDGIAYDPLSGADIFPSAGGIDPGYRVNLSGEIRAGDQFDIEYNANGTGDNRNGLLLAQLYQKGVLENDTLTFAQAYQIIGNDVSSKVNSAQILSTSAGIIKKQAELRRDQISGVSVPEEKMNLVRYQEALEASARIIEAGQQVFDTVIGLIRR